MKKFAIALALVAATGLALADQTQGQGTKSDSTSSAVSQAQGGTTTIGCLVNCASADQGSKDLAGATVTAAQINAGAAKDIAAINAEAAKEIAGKGIRNTPSVNGPPLVSSNDNCMGSASGSANAPGIGLSFGKTYTDTNCVRLKNSRELWNMGMKAAALALMCNDSENREALELTGFECPQTTKARNGNMAVQQHAQATQAQYTDPIVRSRLGLPPLESDKK